MKRYGDCRDDRRRVRGKEDMSVQHAALLAYLTGRPVKVSLSRADSIKVHPKRHAMEIEMTTA